MSREQTIEPFAVTINFDNGRVSPPATLLRRRLSDLKGLFYDAAAYDRALEKDNPLVYEVYEIPAPHEEGQLLSCTTVIYPGNINGEYYFTKGHFHTIENRAEIYTCLQGDGFLLLSTRSGDTSSIRMTPGVSAYIPPFWAHRTLNCGNKPFIFYGVWPGDAGHDYSSILQNGFPLRVFEQDGKPVVKHM